MECNYRKPQLRSDPATHDLLDVIERHATELGLSDATIYAGFPLYREEEHVVVASVLVISAVHGVVIFSPLNGGKIRSVEDLEIERDKADRAFTLVFARLIKSRMLQQSRTQLRVPLHLAYFSPESFDHEKDVPDMDVLIGEQELLDYFESTRVAPIDETIRNEVSSVIEGAKGLLRPKERNTRDVAPTSKVALVAALEAEIRRFDRDQKDGYLAPLDGPQRIRGLAGSGKTVVLAMKAALTHLRNPEAKIAYTFYTKSLYQHVKRLITRFYRQFDEQDPDWDQISVLHAWGGQMNPGLYYNACRTFGVRALTYGDASRMSKAAFDFACRDLLSSSKVEPIYDYIFVDEGQDFAPSFMQLSLKLARRGRVVLAYDELQTIFQAETPSVATIFGVNENGVPLAHFEEDVVLHKCYRNPLEVLVCAHAIGLGLYGRRIIQLPEDEQHWNDLGYTLEEGELVEGSAVSILRPAVNSPSTISSAVAKDQIVIARSFDTPADEVRWVSEQIQHDIKVEGLSAEDILVVSADDRNAKAYASALAESLRSVGIDVNDLRSDSFALRDFSEAGKVTFSTVYQAKGNEGFVVFILGIDAIFGVTGIRNRNIAFTAMTRAKGWLRVTGIGLAAKSFAAEIASALLNCPRLKFTFPPPQDLSVMRRDLDDSKVVEVERSLDDLEESMSIEEYERFLRRRLEEIASLKRGSKRRPKLSK